CRRTSCRVVARRCGPTHLARPVLGVSHVRDGGMCLRHDALVSPLDGHLIPNGCLTQYVRPLSGSCKFRCGSLNRPLAGMNMKLVSLNKGAVRGYRNEVRWACSTVEQGQA